MIKIELKQLIVFEVRQSIINYNRFMSIPILSTKLNIPKIRENFVSRSRLINVLQEGLKQNRKLTLVCAPAGFGKTTLVSEWIISTRYPAAWFSSDKEDHTFIRFMAYFIAALQKIKPGIGSGVLAIMESSQSLPQEQVLTILLNEISLISENFILVLDDTHLIDTPEINQVLTFFLDHLPTQMHLVMITREDPALPLAKYRMRGELTELRAVDLRFTADETDTFFRRVMRVKISQEDAFALEKRTEGWIAGLQLAGLSMQGKDNLHKFVREFTGSHRLILDYLMEEVLHNQTEEMVTFLIRTAILEKLNGSLCEAVCYENFERKNNSFQKDGHVILAQLEKQNLFLVALDDQRNWYRYHHIFADVLKIRLLEKEPELIPVLHQRASLWYEQNGFPDDAITHAIAGKDYNRAAGLLEKIWQVMDASFQSDIWLGWVKQLPENLVKSSGMLSMGYGWALLNHGELWACEPWFQRAELILNESHDDPELDLGLQDYPQREKNVLLSAIATAYAYRALALNDVEGTKRYAQQALGFSPEGDHQWRGAALSLMGISQYTLGRLEAADLSLTSFYENLLKIGNIPDANSITFVLADIKKSLGKLDEAAQIFLNSLQYSKQYDGPYILGVVDLHRGLSEIYLERNQLNLAYEQLEFARIKRENEFLTNWQYRLLLTETKFKLVEKDFYGALNLLIQAEQVYVANPLPDTREMMELKVKIWNQLNKMDSACEWVKKQQLSINDEITFMTEPDLLAFARILLKQKEDGVPKAEFLLNRLHQAAELGKRINSEIKILVLQSLVYQDLQKTDLALQQLNQAINLAEPQGYVRVFVDEGEILFLLLNKLKKLNVQNIVSGKLSGKDVYIQKLLDAFGLNTTSQITVSDSLYLIDPLSEREVEVLRLLSSDLNGPEIAQTLVISLNTLRTHTKNIFRKLGVNNRRAAVRRAEEISLL